MPDIKAYLTNIKPKIVAELQKARQSILVASAYFTDSELTNLLIEKSKAGLSVELIISDNKKINDKANDKKESIDFEKVKEAGINFYRLGEAELRVMHHKFCIIDFETVITGSYNWTYGAIHNEENIVIFKDKLIANNYIERFNELKKEKPFLDFLTAKPELNVVIDKKIVRTGDNIKIDWVSKNADIVTINDENVEAVGSKQYKITENTTFFIKAFDTNFGNDISENILIQAVYPIKIVFNVASNFIIRSQSTVLNWKVENVEKVIILPRIGEVEQQGSYTINPSESTIYKLIATDMLGVETKKEIDVNVYPTPILERLTVSTPTHIRIEANFQTITHEIPSGLNLIERNHFSLNLPRIISLKSSYKTPTVQKLSEALKISTIELNRSIGILSLKTRFYDSLENIFKNKTKALEIIKLIRKLYE